MDMFWTTSVLIIVKSCPCWVWVWVCGGDLSYLGHWGFLFLFLTIQGIRIEFWLHYFNSNVLFPSSFQIVLFCVHIQWLLLVLFAFQYQTQLDYRSGTMTWIIAVVIFLLGFWCCFCIPFCIDSTKDVYHINPNDGTVVGVYKRM